MLAHDALAQRRSDLITVRAMGWSDGESGVDYTVNAGIGLPFMTGGAANGEEPVNHVLPAWDLLTGAYAAFLTLAAERERLRSGRGQEITVPLSDVALAALGHTGLIAEVLHGCDRPRHGNALLTDLEHPSGHRYPAPGSAASFTGTKRAPVERAPRLGEHTDHVLARLLALDRHQIGALHAAGVVAGAAARRHLAQRQAM